MKYFLLPRFRDTPKEEVSAAEFEALRNARLFLSDSMKFEENVLQLIYAAEEFEEFLLKAALHNDLFPWAEYHSLNDTRLRANSRVLGYLNSLTSLRDQFPQFRSSEHRQKISNEFRNIWEQQKKEQISFRFCERLRNYAQHQTQPVHSVTLGGGWNKYPNLKEDRASIYVKTDAVCENRAIPKIEKDAYLSTYGARTDISLIFRQTLSSVGSIATHMRAFTKADFESATETYAAQINAEAKIDAEGKSHIARAVRGSEVIEEFDVFDEFLQRARSLRNTSPPETRLNTTSQTEHEVTVASEVSAAISKRN